MKAITLLITMLLMSACASSYKQKDVITVSTKLERGKSVIIATPENGAYGNIKYSESGRMAATSVNSAFAKFTNAKISTNCHNLTCLQKDYGKYDYYIIPLILHWEDRATEWSGIVDKLEIKLSVYGGNNIKELSSTVISGKSKWMTFGGDHPQDLLPEPVNKYVQSLY